MQADKVKILVVDDEPSVLALVSDLCESAGYNVSTAKSGAIAKQTLEKELFDIVITDLNLGDMNGIEIVNYAKEQDQMTQVIIITGYGTLETAIDAIRNNVFDYITKPFNIQVLLKSIQNAIRQRDLQVENVILIKKIQENEKILEERIKQATFDLEKTNKKLAELAVRDGLTGLYNHKFFHEKLTMEIDRAKRFKYKIGVLIADIDKFKDINDTYGHLKGDEVLVTLSKVLQNSIRRVDILARYGGEEFGVIMPEIKSGCMTVMERIRKKVENECIIPLNKDGEQINLKISCGMSIYPDDADAINDLINKADKAMYHSKKNGRNMSTCYKDIEDDYED